MFSLILLVAVLLDLNCGGGSGGVGIVAVGAFSFSPPQPTLRHYSARPLLLRSWSSSSSGSSRSNPSFCRSTRPSFNSHSRLHAAGDGEDNGGGGGGDDMVREASLPLSLFLLQNFFLLALRLPEFSITIGVSGTFSFLPKDALSLYDKVSHPLLLFLPPSLPSSTPNPQPPSDSNDSGGFGGTGLSPKEAIITILGVNPLTLLLALAAIGMLSANSLFGPGWLRPSVGLKATTFQSRNLVLPLDQPGFLFPKEASLWGKE